MEFKILIIDDDLELNSMLKEYLAKYDFEAITASHPAQGLELLRSNKFDLVVLDIMLPSKNGFQVCREIRQESNIPIIILTARGEVSDRIVGLELGADDYLPKPYEPRELVARIQSILRRIQKKELTSHSKAKLISGQLSLDLKLRDAFSESLSLNLTTMEFEILHLLMQNPGRVLSREELAEKVRGVDWQAFDRTIDVTISKLRSKLKEDPKNPKFLKTIWGTGYLFVGNVVHE